MIIPSFTILSNSALTVGHMEIEHFWGMYDRLGIVTWPGGVLTRELTFALEPVWELFNEVLCSSVDLIAAVVLGVGGAGVGQAAGKCLG